MNNSPHGSLPTKRKPHNALEYAQTKKLSAYETTIYNSKPIFKSSFSAKKLVDSDGTNNADDADLHGGFTDRETNRYNELTASEVRDILWHGELPLVTKQPGAPTHIMNISIYILILIKSS